MAHQIFRKDFYKSCSEVQLGEFFSNISEIYRPININKNKSQLKIYYQRDSLCEKSLEKLLIKFTKYITLILSSMFDK